MQADQGFFAKKMEDCCARSGNFLPWRWKRPASRVEGFCAERWKKAASKVERNFIQRWKPPAEQWKKAAQPFRAFPVRGNSIIPHVGWGVKGAFQSVPKRTEAEFQTAIDLMSSLQLVQLAE